MQELIEYTGDNMRRTFLLAIIIVSILSIYLLSIPSEEVEKKIK